MPTIIDLGAFVLRIYAGEHGLPHVHVLGPDFAAVVVIETGEVSAGEIPAAHRRRAVAAVAEHAKTLMTAWRRFNP